MVKYLGALTAISEIANAFCIEHDSAIVDEVPTFSQFRAAAKFSQEAGLTA